MSRLAGLLILLGLAACAAEAPLETTDQPTRIVSLDYCADQYVLKFADKADILAVSPDADRDFSYMREAAEGIRQVRPLAEDVLALQPDLIVRSYGGGPNAAAYFEGAGIPVLQVGWANDLVGVKRVVQEMADGLGASAQGQVVISEMETRLSLLAQASGDQTLYMTPGGVTSGPGSLIHEMLLAAGLTNFEPQAGWHDLPLERLVREQPDRIAFASFDSHVTPWSSARHPIARQQIKDRPTIMLEGAWTSCGGWFLVDAIEALAEGRS